MNDEDENRSLSTNEILEKNHETILSIFKDQFNVLVQISDDISQVLNEIRDNKGEQR